VRLFVALDLPPGLSLPDPPGPPWRTVPPEKRHVTLVFLGDARRPAVDISTLGRRLLPSPLAPLSLAGYTTLPKRRPRVLALLLSDPTGRHTVLQRRLAQQLDVEGDRPWLPHITIGRTRERIGRTELPDPPELTFTPPSLTLYESRGGRYLPLERVPAQN
jgi:2'-5' RNA ligase